MTDHVLKFRQPCQPRSINRATGMGGRGAAFAVNAEKKKWQEAAFYAWKQQRYGEVGAVLGQPAKVTLHLGFHTNTKRDPHNYVSTVVKWVIDGLVLAGVWEDDNPKYVEVGEPRLVVHSKVPRETPLACEVHFALREEV